MTRAGWIAVGDRLPDENGAYLAVQIFMGAVCVDTATFARFPAKGRQPAYHEWYVDFSRWPERPHPQAIKVTHWMTLPEAPK